MKKKNLISGSSLDVTLTIQNNRSYAQNINILGNVYNPLDTANAVREYLWNITGFSITTENMLTLEYRKNGQTVYNYYNKLFTTQSIDDIVVLLNQLGIGYFYLFTSLGQTYITTNNDNYEFGSLSIAVAAPQLKYFWNTASLVGGNNSIDVNAVNQVNDANPSTANGTVVVVTGDVITFSGAFITATPADPKPNAQVYNLTTNTVLFNSAGASLYNFTFPITGYDIFILTVGVY